MTLLAVGVLVGLMMPPSWRLLRRVVDAWRGDYLDVDSPERRGMLIRDSGSVN